MVFFPYLHIANYQANENQCDVCLFVFLLFSFAVIRISITIHSVVPTGVRFTACVVAINIVYNSIGFDTTTSTNRSEDKLFGVCTRNTYSDSMGWWVHTFWIGWFNLCSNSFLVSSFAAIVFYLFFIWMRKNQQQFAHTPSFVFFTLSADSGCVRARACTRASVRYSCDKFLFLDFIWIFYFGYG